MGGGQGGAGAGVGRVTFLITQLLVSETRMKVPLMGSAAMNYMS